ncbi:HPP family protein [Streptomyces fenghuangensis]|uniref:CBS domain-containing protein n=1 Tax=Streptomyces sp. ICN903 TaxID=2964654 RepID=UPI0027E5A131|nr:CBS domain-containing protein [Streptomyces sp. ICN903]
MNTVPHTPSEEELRALGGRTLTVSGLLEVFGVRTRDDQTVLHITQALKDAGLTTDPDFASRRLREEFQVVLLQSASGTAPDSEAEEEDEGLPWGALPQQPFTIGDIPAARRGVECIAPGAPLTRAMYLMQTKNYSQVPVLDGDSGLRGVVTWRSVAMLLATGKDLDLDDAVEPDPPSAQTYQEFFSLLPTIREHGYVLVRENDGTVTGIVTAADITERFDDTARPFFLVGEIEYRLRRCLGPKIPAEAVKAVQMREKTGRITDLMFGDYVKLLDGDQRNKHGHRKEAACAAADRNWAALGWDKVVDRDEFVRQLDRVRGIRNKIAHFDPEPLPPGKTEELRQFVTLLRQLT